MSTLIKLGFLCKMEVISLLADELLASVEGLSCVELVLKTPLVLNIQVCYFD